MIQSMTAFSQVQFQSNAIILTWEIRSLNHRYLDIFFRLPESVRHLESNFRQCLRGKISRGKLDFQLKISEGVLDNTSIMINEAIVRDLLLEAKRVAVEYDIADDLKLSHVLSWPGVIVNQTVAYDDLLPHVEHLFLEGVEQLLDGKRKEGAVLELQIKTRLQHLRQEITGARESAASMLSMARNKLLALLEDLQMKVADTRLEQELALVLTRLDVSEELDRLDAHVNEVEDTLTLNQSSGKRLDFLMQELNREANTLSSKSDAVQLSQHALHMKVLIEQMREQIQNIE